MQLALVVGTLVATQKHRRFDGAKLLLVQPIAPDETPRGPMLLAVDTVGAGVREKVLIVLDGKAAADAMQRRGTPVDAAILGIVDRVDCDPALIAAMTEQELRELVRRVVADRLGSGPQASGAHARSHAPLTAPGRPARTRATRRSACPLGPKSAARA